MVKKCYIKSKCSTLKDSKKGNLNPNLYHASSRSYRYFSLDNNDDKIDEINEISSNSKSNNNIIGDIPTQMNKNNINNR